MEIQQRRLCSWDTLKSFLYSIFPFLIWTREYNWKKDSISDFVAGITVGIMSIPQGMSYAGVVGIPAVYGLYSNIIPTIVYVFVGTSRLAAIGPPAVATITLGSIRHKFIPDPNVDFSSGCFPMFTDRNNTSTDKNYSMTDLNNQDCYSSWELVISLTFLTGIILVIMGICRFGYLSNHLSDSLIGGFTSGAAIHAMTSQLGYIFGLHLPWHSGPGKIILTYMDLFNEIHEAVITTTIVSASSIITLLAIKFFLNTKFQRVFGAPLPGELLLVILGAAISYFGQFEGTFGVATVHAIPSGFPKPLLPRMDLMRLIAFDAVIVALILYALSISLAKLYAKRNDYEIDAHQEFFAFGLINIIGSFFQCFVAGQIVSRSIVYESAGAKSQLAGAFGSVLVIITVLWVAPLLASLPKCILGSIICAACIQMLRQLKQLKPLYSNSKIDFIVYLCTFLLVVILDVKEGLLASIILALLISFSRTFWQRMTKNGQNGDAYNKLVNKEKTPNEKLFYFDEPLYFANVDRYKRQIYDKCGLTAEDLRQDALDMELRLLAHCDSISTILSTSTGQERLQRPRCSGDYVIIDCSGFHYIDSMGVRALRQVDAYLMKREVTPYYVKCTGDNFKKLVTAQFVDDFRRLRFHPTADMVLSTVRPTATASQYGSYDGRGNESRECEILNSSF